MKKGGVIILSMNDSYTEKYESLSTITIFLIPTSLRDMGLTVIVFALRSNVIKVGS